MVAGGLAIVGAVGVALADRVLAARGMTWRELRPLSMELADLSGATPSRAAALSLERRARRGALDPVSRRLAAERTAGNVTGLTTESGLALPILLALDPSMEAEWSTIIATVAGPPAATVAARAVADPTGSPRMSLRLSSGPIPRGMAEWAVVRSITIDGVEQLASPVVTPSRHEILLAWPAAMEASDARGSRISVTWDGILLPGAIAALRGPVSEAGEVDPAIAHAVRSCSAVATLVGGSPGEGSPR